MDEKILPPQNITDAAETVKQMMQEAVRIIDELKWPPDAHLVGLTTLSIATIASKV